MGNTCNWISGGPTRIWDLGLVNEKKRRGCSPYSECLPACLCLPYLGRSHIINISNELVEVTMVSPWDKPPQCFKFQSFEDDNSLKIHLAAVSSLTATSPPEGRVRILAGGKNQFPLVFSKDTFFIFVLISQVHPFPHCNLLLLFCKFGYSLKANCKKINSRPWLALQSTR